MDYLKLIDFTSMEEAMVRSAMQALEDVGYEVSVFQELIKVEMPPGYRAMTLGNGAALGGEAVASQKWLNHVLEEECLHLIQKAKGWFDEVTRGTVLELELDANESRRFPPPEG